MSVKRSNDEVILIKKHINVESQRKDDVALEDGHQKTHVAVSRLSIELRRMPLRAPEK